MPRWTASAGEGACAGAWDALWGVVCACACVRMCVRTERPMRSAGQAVRGGNAEAPRAPRRAEAMVRTQAHAYKYIPPGEASPQAQGVCFIYGRRLRVCVPH